MPVIRLTTTIAAPQRRCFDLARSVDLHRRGAAATDEHVVAGITHGLMGPGDQVTWRARHFGVWQQLTARISDWDPPLRFRDTMVRGAFARFDHDHIFEALAGDLTAMHDIFDFTSPLGPLGRLADAMFLTAYMRRFLEQRNRVLREVAESDEWRALV